MAYALRRFIFSSLSLWTALALFGIYFLFHLPRYVNFGIDLVGGTYLTLEVQMDTVLNNELSDRVNGLLKKAVAEGYSGPQEVSLGNRTLTAQFAHDNDARLIESIPLEPHRKVHIQRSGARIDFSLPRDEVRTLTRDAVEGNIKVLRSRIDQFGVGEITIAAQGEQRIVVELPHVQDPQQAKKIIGTSALLEIKAVIDRASTEPELLARYKGKLPDGMLVVHPRDKSDDSVYLVPRRADVTGKMLKTAFAMSNGGKFGIEPSVVFHLTSEGGDKFYALTSRSDRPLIAILLDNVVLTAAHAQEPIRTEGSITGRFDMKQAQELASLLRSGAFIAPVTFVEDRTIGPSLGAEAIRQGLIACEVGLILLFLFTLFVYRMAGLFAFIVLLFNMLLILFALAILKATLTLPGIAGMVLTLGMAVDASVLIYERIREELATGTHLVQAIRAGFSGALVVILDANITTFLAACVLYYIGTGPIQGFAATMMVGIISTLITGLVLLRAIFNYAVEGLGWQKLTI